MQSSLETVLMDDAHPDGWLNDEVVSAGIAVRSDPGMVQVVSSLLYDSMVRVATNASVERTVLTPNYDEHAMAAAVPDIRNDRVPALTLMPINRGENHWVLGWINTRTREYGILDSGTRYASQARQNLDLHLIRTFMRYQKKLWQ